MRQSKLFTKTIKEIPKDEVSKNAQLLLRGGFIHKEMAGVYTYLPLGLLVLKKIENIIREEMNAIDGQEIFLTTLQKSELWEKTDRWDEQKVDAWFKTKLKNGEDLGLAMTHEEPLTMIMKKYINSYKDLPKYVYQFQVKFRNEARAKSGIMRGREFLMKDLYSFNKDQAGLDKYYEGVKEAYLKIFTRCGLGNETFVTFASGGIFSKYSHEFQTLTNVGEDTIYLDKKKKIAINKEVYSDEIIKELGLNKKDLKKVKAIEVGNIFKLGTRFSESLGLKYTDEKGKKNPVVMGSYGIGLGRLMGTIVELNNDKDGISWPCEVAPFKVHLVGIGNRESGSRKQAERVYNDLIKAGVEVLYDDREEASAGEKFADADLIGCPYRVVVSEKTVAKDSVEVKKRSGKKAEIVKIEKIVSAIG